MRGGEGAGKGQPRACSGVLSGLGAALLACSMAGAALARCSLHSRHAKAEGEGKTEAVQRGVAFNTQSKLICTLTQAFERSPEIGAPVARRLHKLAFYDNKMHRFYYCITKYVYT